MEAASGKKFSDPTVLTWGMTGVLVIALLLGTACLISSVLQLGFLRDVQAGAYRTHEDLVAAGSANDFRQGLVARGYTLIVSVRSIFFLFWIYRANSNARQLGAADMEFSPGWAVGWFFVPVANLWMPFQVVKEIWNASASPAMWRQRSTPSLVTLWWSLLLTTNLGALLMIIIARAPHTFDLIKNLTLVTILFYVLTTALDAVILMLVRAIYGRQMHHRRSNLAEIFA